MQKIARSAILIEEWMLQNGDLLRCFRNSGLVTYTSTLPSPSFSAPCISSILLPPPETVNYALRATASDPSDPSEQTPPKAPLFHFTPRSHPFICY